MVTFETFVRRFSGLKDFIKNESKRILFEFQDQIVEMQREQHLAGLNKEGTVMQTGYSPGYGKRRKKKGLQTRFVDLHFSGKMHKDLRIIPVKEGIDIRSKQPYEYYVRANFPGSFGLVKENAEVTAEFVANKLAVSIKKYLVG